MFTYTYRVFYCWSRVFHSRTPPVLSILGWEELFDETEQASYFHHVLGEARHARTGLGGPASGGGRSLAHTHQMDPSVAGLPSANALGDSYYYYCTFLKQRCGYDIVCLGRDGQDAVGPPRAVRHQRRQCLLSCTLCLVTRALRQLAASAPSFRKQNTAGLYLGYTSAAYRDGAAADRRSRPRPR